LLLFHRPVLSLTFVSVLFWVLPPKAIPDDIAAAIVAGERPLFVSSLSLPVSVVVAERCGAIAVVVADRCGGIAERWGAIASFVATDVAFDAYFAAFAASFAAVAAGASVTDTDAAVVAAVGCQPFSFRPCLSLAGELGRPRSLCGLEM